MQARYIISGINFGGLLKFFGDNDIPFEIKTTSGTVKGGFLERVLIIPSIYRLGIENKFAPHGYTPNGSDYNAQFADGAIQQIQIIYRRTTDTS